MTRQRDSGGLRNECNRTLFPSFSRLLSESLLRNTSMVLRRRLSAYYLHISTWPLCAAVDHGGAPSGLSNALWVVSQLVKTTLNSPAKEKLDSMTVSLASVTSTLLFEKTLRKFENKLSPC